MWGITQETVACTSFEWFIISHVHSGSQQSQYIVSQNNFLSLFVCVCVTNSVLMLSNASGRMIT